jgi:hypothetical protein
MKTGVNKYGILFGNLDRGAHFALLRLGKNVFMNGSVPLDYGMFLVLGRRVAFFCGLLYAAVSMGAD